MRTITLTKPAAAVTLAALAVFGLSSCSAPGLINGGHKPSSPSTAKPSSAPRTGASMQHQCDVLADQINDVESNLKDAVSDIASSSDKSTVLPKLDQVERDVKTATNAVTDARLKRAAGRLDYDFHFTVIALTDELNDENAGDYDQAEEVDAYTVKEGRKQVGADADEINSICDR